jgi:hypothetical protein
MAAVTPSHRSVATLREMQVIIEDHSARASALLCTFVRGRLIAGPFE